MSISHDEIATEAMKLSTRERAELARQLIQSLEDTDEGEFEAEWIAEAERRHDAYRRGLVKAIPASEVFREAKERPQ